jgi:hypothetical protein
MIDDLPVTVAPVFLPRETRWVVGLDLGQSNDPTAIAVLEHTRGVLDSNTPINRHCGVEDIKQVSAERINCRHLERLPLGMPYPSVVQHVKNLLSRPPLCGFDDVKPAQMHRRDRCWQSSRRHLHRGRLESG